MRNYFGKNQTLPPDPILDIGRKANELRKQHHAVIDISVGYLYEKPGKIWVPPAILLSYTKLIQQSQNYVQQSPGYLAPSGSDELLGHRPFLEEGARLIFRTNATDLFSKKPVAAAGTPGGTGAVRLFAEAMKARLPHSAILIGTPAWSTYHPIFNTTNITILEYPHMKNGKYNLEGHLAAIKKAPTGTVILLQLGKTHNPTGHNPKSDEEWKMLAVAMHGKKAFFDAPYVGLGEGIKEDTRAIDIFLQEEIPTAIALSFAKNTGLYRERPGVLFIMAKNAKERHDIQRLLNACARKLYSSPPAFGEVLIATTLTDPQSNKQWKKDLSDARDTLYKRRQLLAKCLPEFANVIMNSSGLFLTLPLSAKTTLALQKEYIFMVGGRVNVGGLFTDDIPSFASSLKRHM